MKREWREAYCFSLRSAENKNLWSYSSASTIPSWEVALLNTVTTLPLTQCFTVLFLFNNCPTRCNTKQSLYYSASSLYMFRVLTTLIIRSTQNCNYSLRYWSYFCAATSLQRGQLATLEGGSCTVLEAVVTVLCTPDDGCV